MTTPTSAPTKIDGILSFPVTPFAEGGGIDVDAFTAHLRVQLATDASALFVAGAAGEFTALTFAEFATVVRTAVEVSGGAVPVFAGIGGGTEIAREYRDIAIDNGADGLLLLPPYLLASTPAGLVAHIRRVVSGSSVPVIVYQRATAVLNVAAALELLDVPEVLGLKDGLGDVSAMLRIVTAIRTSGHPRAQEFQFFNGLPTAEAGAASVFRDRGSRVQLGGAQHRPADRRRLLCRVPARRRGGDAAPSRRLLPPVRGAAR